MAYRLIARDTQHYLSPWGVISRLKAEFAYVESDAEEGHRHVCKIIGQLEANKRSSRFDANHEYLEHLYRGKERALYVCFGDSPGSDSMIAGTYVVPGTPLVFDPVPYEHGQAVESLLVRCATALGYDIIKDRRTITDSAYRGRERRQFLDRRGLTHRRKTA